MCDHSNSLGSYTSAKRICMDCGANWIKDTSTANYVQSFNGLSSTTTLAWLQDEIERENKIRFDLDKWDRE